MDLDTDTYMTASDAFREGGSYRVTVTLTASEGYEWGDQYGYVVQGSLNGIPVSVRISNGTAVIEYDFEAGGHVCAPKSVAKQNATCTVPGKEAHYQCDCGKIYYDAAARQPINDLSALTIPAAHKDENSDVFCDVCGAQLGEIPVSTETTTVTTAATSAPETTTPTSETTAASETTASTEAAATAPQTTAATEVTTAVPETTTVPETTSAPETAATPETTAAPETAATTEATTAVPETTAAVTDVSAEQSEKPADGNEDKKSRTKKTVIIAGSAVTAVSGGAAALYFGLRKKF